MLEKSDTNYFFQRKCNKKQCKIISNYNNNKGIIYYTIKYINDTEMHDISQYFDIVY